MQSSVAYYLRVKKWSPKLSTQGFTHSSIRRALLGDGLLQQNDPQLLAVGLGEDGLAVSGWDLVVNRQRLPPVVGHVKQPNLVLAPATNVVHIKGEGGYTGAEMDRFIL